MEKVLTSFHEGEMSGAHDLRLQSNGPFNFDLDPAVPLSPTSPSVFIPKLREGRQVKMRVIIREANFKNPPPSQN